MDPDGTLCFCFHITRRKIVNFVKQTRPTKASRISECFGAGSGCGWCIPFLVRIHREVVGGEPSSGKTLPAGRDPSATEEPLAGEEMDSVEYEARRKRYLEGVKDGTRSRHSHADFAAPVAGPAPPGAGPTPPAEEPFDYTRYFSRSRPDPEPETIEE